MAAKPNMRAQQAPGILDVQGPQGGLSAMISEAGGSKSMVKEVQRVEAMPGGMELLYTMAAEDLMKKAGASKGDTKKVRLYKYGGAVEQAFAKGGPARAKSVAAAATARAAGRGEDEMLVHMTEDEFDVIKRMWGEPDINPNTGLPEYGFFSKIWKKVKKVVKKIVSSKIFQIVAPIALSIFAPGLGTWIGGALGASGAAAPIIGQALIQGGLSSAGGGDFLTGALSGAISGGLGQVAGGQLQKIAPGMSDRTAAIVGSGLAGGAASSVTGGDFMEGAVMGGLGEYMQPTIDKLVAKGQDVFDIQDPAGGGILAERIPEAAAPLEGALGPEGLAPGEMGPPAPGYGESGTQMVGPPEAAVAPPTPAIGGGAPAGAAAPGPLGQFGEMVMPALMGAGILGGGGEYEEGQQPEMDPRMLESLPIYEMNRQFQGMDPNAYYTYGQQGSPQTGQHLFMTPEPFAGETGTPTVGPTGGLGVQDDISAMIAAGQPIPASMVRGGGRRLQAAGYTKDASGTWMPPPMELGQGMPNAMGGYQHGGEFDYWAQNADVQRASPAVSAAGRYVKGPGNGRSDDIPARLSDGEYVIDAESVALLGDGSGDAGAKRLDEMRNNLRRHKAKNLSKGSFSHKAKQPAQYMAQGGMAKLRRAMTESGRM